MFRKSTMLAIAAAASFGLAMASAGTASAKPNYPHNGKIAQPKMMPKPHFPKGPPKIVMPRPNKPPHFHPHWPKKPPHWHVHVRHPRVWYAPRPVVYGAVAPVVTATNRCSCLVKEYTPEGAVLFRDVCTNEMAMNPPAISAAPTALVQPPAQQ